MEVAMHGAKTKLPRAEASWFPGANGSMVDLSYCKGKIRITGFGRLYKGEEVDWSFRPFQKFEDGKKDLPSARLLPDVVHALGIKEKIFAPRPVFGTDMCYDHQLRERIPFEHGGKRVTLLRGASADIIMFAPDETFAISVGGCPIGWIFDPQKPNRLIVGHMGLQCLIDRQLIVAGQKSRKHRSVIDRMWESMNLLPREAARIQAGYAFPIDPLHYVHQWDYPDGGDNNKRVCEYLAANFGNKCIVDWNNPETRKLGRIHLGNLIRSQYAALGIPPENMHGASTPDAVDADGHPLWYVTRGPHGKDPRNLVLVTLYQ
ncbi:hypothetical protein A3D68_01445 [Candidatus Adlerbacteria bacterium RIFCSPHIGHO2_02_FULL_52_17]|uniref:Uncharacterized protein n=1 Tax=Candidatus Adlerbacteria bacterium RIFCSPHIGHO2_02_FULL_52_17 TaxID=1797240 RepID=A0A1F4XR83_9BACT|nr:MAG: hypothetical protein A3D68_01445 [Candidatus Adlerbacteria bacterium RIFCSPHIGHO2_02_FULL_52_17]